MTQIKIVLLIVLGILLILIGSVIVRDLSLIMSQVGHYVMKLFD